VTVWWTYIAVFECYSFCKFHDIARKVSMFRPLTYTFHCCAHLEFCNGNDTWKMQLKVFYILVDVKSIVFLRLYLDHWLFLLLGTNSCLKAIHDSLRLHLPIFLIYKTWVVSFVTDKLRIIKFLLHSFRGGSISLWNVSQNIFIKIIIGMVLHVPPVNDINWFCENHRQWKWSSIEYRKHFSRALFVPTKSQVDFSL
jgi:hypothetical protein